VGRFVRLMPSCAGILGIATVLLVAGCGGGGKTRFQFMNAVPNESNLEVLVNSTSVANNVAYGTSTGYQSVNSGSQQVVIEPSGSSTALMTQSIDFASGTDTTLIAFNFSSNLSTLALTDDNSAPFSGDFKLRIVNVAPGLGPADVYIVAAGTDLNTVSPTLSNVAFGSASGYQSVAAGSYEVVLTLVGEKFPAVDTGSLTFSGGQVRTFVGLNSQSNGFTYTMLQDVN
jgi:uncharacterized protein DUF4397